MDALYPPTTTYQQIQIYINRLARLERLVELLKTSDLNETNLVPTAPTWMPHHWPTFQPR